MSNDLPTDSGWSCWTGVALIATAVVVMTAAVVLLSALCRWEHLYGY